MMIRVFRAVAVLVVFGFVALQAAEPTPIAFKQVRLGPAVLSLPANWTALPEAVPVWIHLHGAPATVEKNFAEIGAPGVLVNVTLNGLSKVYADFFTDPEVFARLLRDTEAALRAESTAHAWRVGNVTMSAFSAGFGGVRQLLKQPDAFQKIGALVMADSIYCGYAGDPAEKRVDPELMEGFVRFAKAASDGRKRLVISHSSQVPPGYASTTETADYLIAQLGGARSFEAAEWPGGLKLKSNYSSGSVEILGFEGEEAEDHMRHLRQIGSLLERVAPVAPLRPAATVAELRAQLQAHVTQARFRRALWGVKVVSLDSGATLFEHAADRLQSPASNSKLYVGALALDQLGGDYRIATPLLGTVAPDAAGTLRGDLIVSGRGDPSWKSPPKREAFWKTFEPFVAALQRAGVKRITGDLLGDATYFRQTPNGAGWTADDLNDYYGAEISALTLEDNYVELSVAPGASVGAPALLTWLQPHAGLVLDNRATTGAKGSTRRIEVRRLIGENVVHVFGSVPLGAATVNEDVTVPRPAGWFVGALKEALGNAGIVVEGSARHLRWPDASPVREGAVKLGEVTSPPLRELVRGFMKPSQNLETDLIFSHLGEGTRQADTPETRETDTLALATLRAFLTKIGVAADEVRFDEGSGLSRNNLTSANAIITLLRHMAAHREAEAFRESLPIAGVDGTLRRRMKATAAEGNVRAKTGTLRWANSISGYVTTAAGEKLAFSVMLNRAVVPAGRNARDDVDAIAIILAQFAGRSAAGGAADGK